MSMVNAVDLIGHMTGVSGPFCAYGSFGMIDGAGTDNQRTIRTNEGYSYTNDSVRVDCRFEAHEHGVYVRRDTFTNISNAPITLNCYTSRYCFEGSSWEVYTQYNNWERESQGSWQPLHTNVSVENVGMRTSDGAAPICALKSKLNGKGYVFHLVPNARWHISVKRLPSGGKNDLITVELGIHERGFALSVAPGETVEMPLVISYPFRNELDLDAWKLHKLCAKLWPRRATPVLYNTWLLNFDSIDVDNILAQVTAAAEMGIEVFVIDAGWFGKGDSWYLSVGDWHENLDGGYYGRLKEVSDAVRAAGMKFGLWMEPERATVYSDMYAEHPEYFFGCGGENVFLDFTHEGAFDYILNTVFQLVECYHIEYFKFDFNANMSYDPQGSSFYRYSAAHRRFIAAIRERYPDVYLTNCASGGLRMDLANSILFDSNWLSDNQGPFDTLRIKKESMLRLPPAVIEPWNVQRFVDGFPDVDSREPVQRAVVCNNATWDMLTSVRDEFWFGLFFGGTFGYSCDIAAFPQAYKEKAAAFIAKFKQERNDWMNVTCRLLADHDGITVLQYENERLGRSKVLVFTSFTHQSRCTIYPKLPASGYWTTSDGARIDEEGITILGLRDNDCRILELWSTIE